MNNLSEIDKALFYFINQNLKNDLFDNIMPFITSRTFILFLPFMLVILLKEKKNAIPAFFTGIAAAALADAASHGLKDLFMRTRPCNALDNINLLVGCSKSFSMPSSHASNSFAFAATIWFMLRSRLSLIFVVPAALIGVSRIFVGVHYPSDVVVGALVGTAVAYMVTMLYGFAKKVVMKHSYEQTLFLVLLIMAILRIYYMHSGLIDLSADEAHYWEWSRRPDWSYYSKGPLIAWLISIGTFFFGNTVLGIRIFAVIFSALSSLLVFRLGRKLYDDRTGFAAATLIQTVPLFSVYGLIFTIDSPFIFFWILSFYIYHRIIGHESDDGSKKVPVILWISLGISAGLGLLAKYTMAFFLLSALLHLLFSARARRLLMTPGPYVAFIVCMITFSPVIFWNASHGWVTLKHTAGQAHIKKGIVFSWQFFAEFIGSQLGVMTPLLFLMSLAATIKLRKTEHGRLLFWFSMPVIIFFTLKSMQGKVQANWPMTGYISAVIAFCGLYISRWESLKRPQRVMTVLAVSVSLVFTLFTYATPMLKLPRKLDPSAKLVGWKELGLEAGRIQKEMSLKGPLFVVSDSYQVASELAFYMDGHPTTYCINLGRRMNQYDIWPGPEQFKGQNALLIRARDKRNIPQEVLSAFETCSKQTVEIRTSRKKRLKFGAIACYDFKGFELKKPEKF